MVKNAWIRELRAPFLLLSLIFVSLGTAIARIHGAFDPLVTVLTLVGVLSLHMSVNVLNDYFDYRSGIDIITTHRLLSAEEAGSYHRGNCALVASWQLDYSF